MLRNLHCRQRANFASISLALTQTCTVVVASACSAIRVRRHHHHHLAASSAEFVTFLNYVQCFAAVPASFEVLLSLPNQRPGPSLLICLNGS